MAAVFVCAAVGAAQDAPPQQDVLVFANGDRLTGKLLRGVKDSVVFHSDVLGDVTVPLAKIKDLQSSGSFAVLRKGVPVDESQRLKPEPIQISSEGVVMVPVDGPAAPAIPLQQVAYIVDAKTFDKDLVHRAGLLDGWSGSVTAGATVAQSTQHGGTFNTAASFVRQVPLLSALRARNKTTFGLQETYGTLTTPVISADGVVQVGPADVVKTSVFHADVERDEYFSPRGYALANAEFDHNYSQGLQLQQTYGVGVGATVFTSRVQKLELKVDLHYQKQEFFVASQNLNLIGATLAENYRAELPYKVVFTESAGVSPAFNDLNAYAANGNFGLAVPVFKQLSVSLTATDSFLNNPSPGYQKNSLQLNTGLTYLLK